MKVKPILSFSGSMIAIALHLLIDFEFPFLFQLPKAVKLNISFFCNQQLIFVSIDHAWIREYISIFAQREFSIKLWDYHRGLCFIN